MARYTVPVKRILITPELHAANMRAVSQVGSLHSADFFVILRNNHRRRMYLTGATSYPFEAYRTWVVYDALEGVSEDELISKAKAYSDALTGMLQEQPIFV